ncbi:MAG: Hpt domain-containing protein [Gammaproteobacteria bacterium]|nr:Hpt domain-containing protein [Gammaproteobacteria bacterium]
MSSSDEQKLGLDFLTKLKRNYIDELPERLDRIESELLNVEKNGDHSGETFNSIFRHIHSLKGSGGTYGFFIISTICHKFENYLRTVGDNSATPQLKREDIKSCLQFLDLLKDTAEKAAAGVTDFSEVEAELAMLQEQDQNAIRPLKAKIVTNSRVVSSFCKGIMSELGIESELSDNSYSALLQLLTSSYDILITDAEMPLLTGSALIAAVRLSERRNKTIHTVLITSSNALQQRSNREIDPDYVLHKDKDLAFHLEQTLQSILNKAKRQKLAG